MMTDSDYTYGDECVMYKIKTVESLCYTPEI